MIQTYTFHVPLEQHDPVRICATLRAEVKKLVKFQHVLRGFTAAVEDDLIVVKLRVAGINRWNISADARRLALLILRRAGVAWKEAKFQTYVTEPNGHDLKLGEGRTPRSKIPRAQRDPRGNRWDHIAWWGDSLEED